MTLAELYAALGAQENGADLVSAVKAEIARVNSEAAGYRTGKNQAETKLAEMEARIQELTEKGTGDQDNVRKLQTQLDALVKKYEAAENARKVEQQKRIKADILTQTVAALTKGNAANPQELAKILVQSVTVNEDGSYHFMNADGTEGTIEDGAAGWLKANAWAVKNTQKAGSGVPSAGGAGRAYTAADLKSMSAEEINAHWTDIEKGLSTKGD